MQGFTIDDDTLALDMIAQIGPGGHHFGTPHTQARFKSEFYQSTLADRLGYDAWQDAGSQSTTERAHKVWKELLKQYQPPPLEPAIRESLEAFVARRERELEGVNLYD